MQDNKLFPQPVAAFHARRIADNCIINRANLLAGWRVVMTHALRAAVYIDLINAFAHGNRLIRALGLAHIAIDTAFSDQQSHVQRIPLKEEGT